MNLLLIVCWKQIVFVNEYIQNDITDITLYLLHDKNSRDISLHCVAFLYVLGDSLGFTGDSTLQ